MRIAVLVAALGLTACGTFADNAVSGRPDARPDGGSFGVAMSDARPETVGYPVEGISCKNKLWDPEPSNEAAKAIMRMEAAKLGYTSVYLLRVAQVRSAVGLNCWEAISAKGIAFNPEG